MSTNEHWGTSIVIFGMLAGSAKEKLGVLGSQGVQDSVSYGMRRSWAGLLVDPIQSLVRATSIVWACMLSVCLAALKDVYT